MTEPDEKFASRWSRRKRDARVEQRAESPGLAGPPRAPAGAVAPAMGEDTPGRTPEAEAVELPDPDTLDADADFTVFLKDNVPEALRRRALRRLWRLNPVLANLDGLNDYDDDFTDAATVVEGLKTLYKVGKGFVEDEEEDEAREKPDRAARIDAGAEAEAGAPDASKDETETAAEGTEGRPTEARRIASLRGDEIGRDSRGAGLQAGKAPGPEKTLRAAAAKAGNRRRGAAARRWGGVDD